VLTGEAINAQRACEWGLVEQVSSNLDADVERLLKTLLAADAKALRLQKELVQLWEEAPLSKSVAASLASFAGAHRR
jgi:enoyl-CoA hydratase/carnithine racemase